jgi:hypothetical protein
MLGGERGASRGSVQWAADERYAVRAAASAAHVGVADGALASDGAL